MAEARHVRSVEDVLSLLDELYDLGNGPDWWDHPDSLRRLFADLTEVDLRRMRDEPPDSPLFGEKFLWTALFRRTGTAGG